MRRSNRSIEVFDISLMAVVTKAMGAFLVLMLLLMPYYSSGPVGQQAAEDLSKKIEEIDAKITTVINRLTNASAEDLRKLLDEALRELEDARRLLAELHRANDALNAQVRRLEQEKKDLADQVVELQQRIAALTRQNRELAAQMAELERQKRELAAQVAELQRRARDLEQQNRQLAAQVSDLQRRVQELNTRVAQLESENEKLRRDLSNANDNLIAGQLLNWDCMDVSFTVGVWTLNSFVVETKSKYVLMLRSLGDSYWTSDVDILKEYPNQSENKPGQGQRFNSASFVFRGASPGRYALVVTSRSNEPVMIGERRVWRLRRPSSDCSLKIGLQARNKAERYVDYAVIDKLFPKSQYALILWDVVVAADNQITTADVAPEHLAWLQEQLAHADKEP